MTHLVRLCTLSTLLVACGTDGLIGVGQPTIENGPTVKATLSAVSLSYDCGAASDFADRGACAEGTECPSFCQQSNLQIDLVAQGGSATVVFEVLAVRILNEADASHKDEVESRSPKRWTSGGYVAWDQQIAPNASLKVSYDLSAPDWAALHAPASGQRLSGETYRVEVDVRINGVTYTISLDGVTREPEVAT